VPTAKAQSSFQAKTSETREIYKIVKTCRKNVGERKVGERERKSKRGEKCNGGENDANKRWVLVGCASEREPRILKKKYTALGKTGQATKKFPSVSLIAGRHPSN